MNYSSSGSCFGTLPVIDLTSRPPHASCLCLMFQILSYQKKQHHEMSELIRSYYHLLLALLYYTGIVNSSRFLPRRYQAAAVTRSQGA